MADKPIRDLPVVTTVDDNIQFPVDQDGVAMRLFIDDLKASFADYVSTDIEDKVSTAIEDWFDEHGESGGKLCVISGVSPFTSSMTYSELYETLVTNNQSVVFLFQDQDTEYLTSLAYVDSSKVKAIFITQKSSGTYPVIYVDIKSNGAVEINVDSIGDGTQVTQNAVVLRVDDNGYVYNGTSAITGSQINSLAATQKAVFLWDEDNQRLYTYGEPNGSGAAEFFLSEDITVHVLAVSATRNVATHRTAISGVTSVNGKAGAVELTTSDIENDSGYISESGIETVYHHYDGVGDTSWILLKIPREQFKLSFHNCSETDSDSPTTLVSNPKAWLEEHLAYFLSHNCNFGGAEWGSRWNGQEYARNIDATLYPTPRNYFAFDSETEECAYYPSSVYDSTNLLAAIPARFDIVFACGDPFVLDGVPNTDYYLDGGTGTRTAFGWDDDYYYVLSGEGRGTYERGLTLDEVKAIFVANNVENAVNFDGGGSVCLAARVGGSVEKINRFRDCSLPYPQLRAVGLCAAYERRSGE